MEFQYLSVFFTPFCRVICIFKMVEKEQCESRKSGFLAQIVEELNLSSIFHYRVS